MPGYSMSADEVNYWSDLAALLDPDAYVFDIGTSQTHTVGAGERDYLVNGWYLAATGGGVSWFHRVCHIWDAHLLSAGATVTTDASNAGSSFYICQPNLVTGGDSRYASDPRALFFDRLTRISELTHYQLGDTETTTNDTTVPFPTDFTDGLMLHTSSHDVAWTILLESGAAGGINTLNEISDASRIRFAQPTLFPFKRTTFPNIKIQGVGQAEGRGTVTYLKLPGDW